MDSLNELYEKKYKLENRIKQEQSMLGKIILKNLLQTDYDNLVKDINIYENMINEF
jgi:hypothetical protein